MSQFESEFEQKLYAQRQEKLREIQAIGQRLGLTAAESIYPNRFPAADEAISFAQIPELLAKFDSDPHPVSTEQLEADKPELAVAGRIMSIRVQGKAGFAHLQQGGKRLQIYVRKDDVGDDIFALYKLLDLGDHIGVRGHLMRTRTGELTLKAAPVPSSSGQPKPAISFLTKAMLALPDKYHGLEDVELRYRQRYVDLIMNSGTLAKQELPPEHNEPGSSPVTETAAPNELHNDAPRNVREVFVKRAAVLRAIRRFFDERGYLEVETPMMHTIAGGAAARPFKTHHNALDIPLSLRIAPELYLKRLVVGGLDRVYEINRNFRNEGVSTQHNPEFTMLEFYQAYANYHDLMDLTQQLIKSVAIDVNGTTKTWFNGTEIDLAHWQKLSMREAIIKFWPENTAAPGLESFADYNSLDKFVEATHKALRARDEADAQRGSIGDPTDSEKVVIARTIAEGESAEYANALIRVQRNTATLHFGTFRTNLLVGQINKAPLGKYIAELFELLSEPHLIQPTIIYDFPLAVSPLSKIKPDEPDWVERFEFYIGGFEVGNAFSELNDAADQLRRFEDQVADKDPESMAEVDEDYVRALGYGLPPTAGEGIGIDRLTMILTGARSIRDVILFPLMRPIAKAPAIIAEEEEHTHGESAE